MPKTFQILTPGAVAYPIHDGNDKPSVPGFNFMEYWKVSAALLENEVWKDIPSTKGRYQASNLGRIRSLVYRFDSRRKSPKIISQYLTNTQYCRCVIRDTSENNYKTIFRSVHRLVAESFIEKQEGRTDVNHIDANKQNNTIENLEWCTPAENNVHGWSNGLFDSVKKLSGEQIQEIYNSNIGATKLSQKYGVSITTVTEIKGARRHTDKIITNGNRNKIVISNDTVLSIYNSSGGKHDVAKKHNVSPHCVWSIRTGRTFADLTGHNIVTTLTNATKLSDNQIEEIKNSPLFIKDILKKYKISFHRYKAIKGDIAQVGRWKNKPYNT